MPRSSSPRPTFSATVRHGSSANCWNTMAMRLRAQHRAARRRCNARRRSRRRRGATSTLAARDLVEAVDGAQDRRLARAREAHQHADLARLDGEVDAGRAEHDARSPSGSRRASRPRRSAPAPRVCRSPKTMSTLSKTTADIHALALALGAAEDAVEHDGQQHDRQRRPRCPSEC